MAPTRPFSLEGPRFFRQHVSQALANKQGWGEAEPDCLKLALEKGRPGLSTRAWRSDWPGLDAHLRRPDSSETTVESQLPSLSLFSRLENADAIVSPDGAVCKLNEICGAGPSPL